MFFWLWQGYHYAHGQMNDAYDATKILEKYGMDVLFRKDSSVSPAGQFHFGESRCSDITIRRTSG